MMVDNRKIKLAAGFALMITFFAPESKAFPLMCSDPSRLAASYRVTAQEVMIIKQEIESNLNIIKEIQHGGYAAAGATIFAKIQNGDYDRFGKSYKALKDQTKQASDEQNATDEAINEDKSRRQGLMEQWKKENSGKQAQAERMQEYNNAAEAAKQDAKNNRGNNVFSSAYNWLKNNQSFTQGMQDTLNGVANGDVSGVLSGSFGAAAGASGEDVLNSLGQTASGVADSLENNSGLKDTLEDMVNNSKLQNGLSGVADEINSGQEEKAAQEKAQEELNKKAENNLQNSLENAKNELREQLCSMCKENAKKSGKNDAEAAMSCLAECTK